MLPLFIWDPESAGIWRDGAAVRWWLHHSLTELNHALERLGNRLIIRAGDSASVISALAAEIGADTIFCNRHEEPWARAQETKIADRLRHEGRQLESGNAGLLFAIGSITNQSGLPFRVFTPFWRAYLAGPPPALPLAAPDHLPAPLKAVTSLAIADLDLLPKKPDWAGGLRDQWQPGAEAAQARLDNFVNTALDNYAKERDRPDLPATSALSPHLRFGEISPRQIFHHVRRSAPPSHAADKFLAELGWREFSYHLLGQFPDLPERPLRPEFALFPWQDNETHLNAWQRGQTGFPIVDAGMRQLWQTGWMHNRVRMVVASFLVKNLLIPWQQGEAWFWDTLVDADLASNSASWQWVAGCGADAAPFFRIFNPVLQGEKFDPSGAYVRQYCPELAKLPDRYLHRPWEAPPLERMLAKNYPPPMVDLAATRDRALAAFKTITGQEEDS